MSTAPKEKKIMKLRKSRWAPNPEAGPSDQGGRERGEELTGSTASVSDLPVAESPAPEVAEPVQAVAPAGDDKTDKTNKTDKGKRKVGPKHQNGRQRNRERERAKAALTTTDDPVILRQHISDLQQQLSDKQRSSDDDQQTYFVCLSGLESDLEAARNLNDDAYKAMADEKRDHERQFAKLQKQHEDEKQRLEYTLTIANTDLEIAKTQMKLAQQEQEHTQRGYDNLKDEVYAPNKGLSYQLEQLQKENGTLKQRMENMKRQASHNLTENKELQDTIEAFQTRLDENVGVIEKARSASAKSATKVQEMIAQQTSTQKEHDEAVSALKHELDGYEQFVSVYNAAGQRLASMMGDEQNKGLHDNLNSVQKLLDEIEELKAAASQGESQSLADELESKSDDGLAGDLAPSPKLARTDVVTLAEIKPTVPVPSPQNFAFTFTGTGLGIEPQLNKPPSPPKLSMTKVVTLAEIEPQLPSPPALSMTDVVTLAEMEPIAAPLSPPQSSSVTSIGTNTDVEPQLAAPPSPAKLSMTNVVTLAEIEPQLPPPPALSKTNVMTLAEIEPEVATPPSPPKLSLSFFGTIFDLEPEIELDPNILNEEQLASMQAEISGNDTEIKQEPMVNMGIQSEPDASLLREMDILKKSLIEPTGLWEQVNNIPPYLQLGLIILFVLGGFLLHTALETRSLWIYSNDSSAISQHLALYAPYQTRSSYLDLFVKPFLDRLLDINLEPFG